MDTRWKKDFSSWIGKRFHSYGLTSLESTHLSNAYVQLHIGNEYYEISNTSSFLDYYGQEENTAIFSLEEDSYESFEDIMVDETIQAIYVIQEEQNYFENKELKYRNFLTRALIIETDIAQYGFEKDDVSFSEWIHIKKGKDVLSTFPKKNLWFEEEAFFGMDDISTTCLQEVHSFKPKEKTFMIQGKSILEVQNFIKGHPHCLEEDFLYIFGKHKICVECTCGKRLEIQE
ncbi:MAG: hypothetical protein Q4C49_02505 [Bacillota bacterium]|nr:hypothetical protein [Bacillota bacterium]